MNEYTPEEKARKENIEIPDTWIDFFMYPAGVVVGALLAEVIRIILQ